MEITIRFMVILILIAIPSRTNAQDKHQEALEYAKNLQAIIMKRDVESLLNLISDGLLVYGKPESKKRVTALLRNKKSQFYLHTFGREGSALAYFFSFDNIRLDASEKDGVIRVKYISFTSPFENSESIYLIKRNNGFFLLSLFPLDDVHPNEEMARRREEKQMQ